MYINGCKKRSLAPLINYTYNNKELFRNRLWIGPTYVHRQLGCQTYIVNVLYFPVQLNYLQNTLKSYMYIVYIFLSLIQSNDMSISTCTLKKTTCTECVNLNKGNKKIYILTLKLFLLFVSERVPFKPIHLMIPEEKSYACTISLNVLYFPV